MMCGCIVWKGAVSDGYGRIGTARAHRVAWEREHGPIPTGYVLHHDCGEKLCVNVAHLRCMTVAEHMREHDNTALARWIVDEGQPTLTEAGSET